MWQVAGGLMVALGASLWRVGWDISGLILTDEWGNTYHLRVDPPVVITRAVGSDSLQWHSITQ